MKEESIKIYQRRIVSANKSELIVILYDIIIENLNLAIEAGEGGEEKERKQHIKKAESFVKELLLSLDTKYELSLRLASLYLYVNQCLNFSFVNGNQDEIRTALRIVEKLRLSFLAISETDTSPPLMENTEQLFAGFTYAKDRALAEMASYNGSINRGYRI